MPLNSQTPDPGRWPGLSYYALSGLKAMISLQSAKLLRMS